MTNAARIAIARLSRQAVRACDSIPSVSAQNHQVEASLQEGLHHPYSLVGGNSLRSHGAELRLSKLLGRVSSLQQKDIFEDLGADLSWTNPEPYYIMPSQTAAGHVTEGFPKGIALHSR